MCINYVSYLKDNPNNLSSSDEKEDNHPVTVLIVHSLAP